MLPMGSQLFCGSAQWPCRCDCDHPALVTEELLLAATIFFSSLFIWSCTPFATQNRWAVYEVSSDLKEQEWQNPHWEAVLSCLVQERSVWVLLLHSDLSGLPRYVQGWCLCIVLTVFILVTMVRSVFGTMIVQLSSTTNLYWSEITLQIC